MFLSEKIKKNFNLVGISFWGPAVTLVKCCFLKCYFKSKNVISTVSIVTIGKYINSIVYLSWDWQVIHTISLRMVEMKVECHLNVVGVGVLGCNSCKKSMQDHLPYIANSNQLSDCKKNFLKNDLLPLEIPGIFTFFQTQLPLVIYFNLLI